MIGQKKLIEQIDKMTGGELLALPRFIILVGAKNSGRKMIAAHIAKKAGARLIISDIKVDAIRDIIPLAYKQNEVTVYLLPDADKMSPAAKNALLKITEEPPRKAYFIMTIQDEQQTLATLRSRGTVIRMNPYTPDELIQYANKETTNFCLDEKEEVIVSEICQVPGDVDTLVRYDMKEFYKYIETVIDNIGVVNGANAFKIGSKLSYKEDDGGWDITLFMRAVMAICRSRIDTEPAYAAHYLESIRATSKYLSELAVTGINKSSTIDMWILAMREIWMEVE